MRPTRRPLGRLGHKRSSRLREHVSCNHDQAPGSIDQRRPEVKDRKVVPAWPDPAIAAARLRPGRDDSATRQPARPPAHTYAHERTHAHPQRPALLSTNPNPASSRPRTTPRKGDLLPFALPGPAGVSGGRSVRPGLARLILRVSCDAWRKSRMNRVPGNLFPKRFPLGRHAAGSCTAAAQGAADARGKESSARRVGRPAGCPQRRAVAAVSL